jgi:hypothetical protein
MVVHCSMLDVLVNRIEEFQQGDCNWGMKFSISCGNILMTASSQINILDNCTWMILGTA